MKPCLKNLKGMSLKCCEAKKKLEILTVLLILGFGLARGQKIDSLKEMLNKSTGIERRDILFQLANRYIDIDSHLGLEYSIKAFNAAKESESTFHIVETGRVMSLAYDKLGQIDSTIILLDQILPIAIQNNYDNEVLKILNILGVSYTYKAEYDKALKFHFQSLQLREEKGDIRAVSVSLSNIGLVYYKMKDYYKALSFFKRSLILKNQVKGADVGILLVNISLCYTHMNDFKQAKSVVVKAINSCKNNCPKEFLMSAFYSLGLVSNGLRNFKQAESEFLQSYSLSKELGDQRFQLDNIVFLSKIYIRSNQLKLAEGYLRETQELVK